jgi:hypothetical protein
MRLRGIVETLDQTMLLECGLNNPPLHAASASMNQSHFAKSRLVRGVHVFFDYRLDVARMEGVEVD